MGLHSKLACTHQLALHNSSTLLYPPSFVGSRTYHKVILCAILPSIALLLVCTSILYFDPWFYCSQEHKFLLECPKIQSTCFESPFILFSCVDWWPQRVSSNPPTQTSIVLMSFFCELLSSIHLLVCNPFPRPNA